MIFLGITAAKVYTDLQSMVFSISFIKKKKQMRDNIITFSTFSIYKNAYIVIWSPSHNTGIIVTGASLLNSDYTFIDNLQKLFNKWQSLNMRGRALLNFVGF